MNTIINIFLPVSIWLQDVPGWVSAIFKGITFLGNTEFYLIVMPALFWCIDTVLGIRIGIMLLVSGGLNGLLKFIFKWPRPFWVSSQVSNLVSAEGFGFPSGHAQNAASLWGLLAASSKKIGLRWAAGGLIFLIGLSRIVLGVHFTQDVIMGWLVGGLLLWVYIKAEDQVVTWFKEKSFLIQLAALIAATSLFILPALLIVPPFNPPALPLAWIEGAGTVINPFSYDGQLTTAGSFFGLGLGILFLNQLGTFSAQGSIWQRIIRYVIGLIGVLLIYLGLGSLFPDNIDLISYILRFVRYTLIGLWISFGAPYLFTRLGLTNTPSR